MSPITETGATETGATETGAKETGATKTGTAKTEAAGSRLELGRAGEETAARFLAARGYQIVARNVRADRVELDLIVRRGSTLVFVEVKTRREAGHGLAAEAVDPRKQQRLRRGARAWLATRPDQARGITRQRFDVVTCILLRDCSDPQNATSAPDGTRWSIEHWEAAF